MQIMEEFGSSALPDGESFVAAVSVDRVHEAALPGSAEAAAHKAREEALEKLGVASSMVWGLSQTRLVIVRASKVSGKPKEVSGNHHLMEVAKPEDTKKGVGFGKLGMSIKLFGIPFTVSGKKKDVDEFLFTLQQVISKNRGKW